MIARILEGCLWICGLVAAYPIGYALGKLLLLILFPPLDMTAIMLR